MTPSSANGRIFTISFILLGGTLQFAWLAANVGEAFERSKAEESLGAIDRVDLGMILAMDDDGDGSVDWAEFLEFVLLQSGKVEQRDVDLLRKTFERLDTSGDGKLDAEDLNPNAIAAAKKASTLSRLVSGDTSPLAMAAGVG